MNQLLVEPEDPLSVGYLDSLLERLKALPREEWKTVEEEAEAAIDGVDAVSTSILLCN